MGGDKTLTATAVPSDTPYEWFSEDETIATMSEAGKAAGVKEGTTNVGVKTLDGKVVSMCKVTVSAAE